MKLSDWVRKEGINYRTAFIWFKNGTLPVPAKQLPTGTILVYPEETNVIEKYVIYARVSSQDQKEDLQRQLLRLKNYAANNGIIIANEFTEIASGMNSNRIKLNKILQDKSITHIIVEHKDRLSRFGFELIQSSLNANNRKIIVINETEEKFDLIQDFIDVVTSMCARIYGKKKQQKIKQQKY
jgi:putative resolvase